MHIADLHSPGLATNRCARGVERVGRGSPAFRVAPTRASVRWRARVIGEPEARVTNVPLRSPLGMVWRPRTARPRDSARSRSGQGRGFDLEMYGVKTPSRAHHGRRPAVRPGCHGVWGGWPP